MTRSFPCWLAAAVLTSALALPGAIAPVRGRAGPALRLIYTGSLRGVLEPCGCQSIQPGGLSRRMTLLRRLRRPGTPTLLLDVGDNVQPGLARPEVLGFVYHTLKEIGYNVVNVGPFDLTVPAGKIREAAASAGLALVSGSSAPGVEPPGPHVRLLQAGGMRVAVMAADPAPAGSRRRSATEQVAAAARRARPSAGLVVVLSQLAPDEVERCARAAPEVDLFISGRQDAAVAGIRRIGRAIVLPCAMYAQAVGVVDVFTRPDGRVRDIQARSYPIDQGLARDPGVDSAVQRFYKERLTLLPASGVFQQTAEALSGALGGDPGTSCQSCHQQEHAAWRGTRHAHAWQTLADHGAGARADCISCHTTSHLSLVSLSPGMTGVGCVTCHGGDPDHARHPRDPRFIVLRPAEALCRTCHTPLQSPRFSYRTYLPLIMHAARRAAGGAARRPPANQVAG
jgi:hypothetical protein